MKTNEILLIDLSSLAYPTWHQTQSDPNPNATSVQVLARVRALATNHPHAGICCDSGRSFRNDLSPDYKATRPERDASLLHQIALVIEQLDADGFPVWKSKGFEADDIIATATARALALDPDMCVLICSADKDMMQLVSPRVKVKSTTNDTIYDEQGVIDKFKVRPDQMRDFLSLIGDKADNVAGAKGIGPTRAGDLLSRFGTLEKLYQDLADVGATGLGITPAIAQALAEFRAVWPKTAELITLRTDAPIPFEQVAAERVGKEVETFGTMDGFAQQEAAGDDIDEAMPTLGAVPPAAVVPDPPAQVPPPAVSVEPPAQEPAQRPIVAPAPPRPVAEVLPVAKSDGMAVRPKAASPTVIDVEYERQLDPRSPAQAEILARYMHESHLFAGYGNPQAVLSTIMIGRELGLPALASLRQIHIIEGRHGLSAQLMVALVLRSGMADYFTPIEVTDTTVTYETKRKGSPAPVRLTHTLQMAVQAQLVKPNSNWEKVPTDMLVARCSSRLCRLVYPDIIGGLYTPDELREIAEGRAA